jgi:hypothetical protein
MTADTENSVVESPKNDKELNFRALESRLKQEREARLEAERKIEEISKRSQQIEDEEDDSEPYVNSNKLKKTLNKFGQTTQSEIQKAMEIAKMTAKEELKQEMWLENNPDFYDTLKHAEKFALRAPKLADAILKMPEGFERQKLVYQNIKELGIDRPEKKNSSIQDQIDGNKKNMYYQPTGIGTAAYNSNDADFSSEGQKSAYEKMQKLKKRLTSF